MSLLVGFISKIGLSALLLIGNSFVNPTIVYFNHSGLDITIGDTVDYFYDVEYNEWYPAVNSSADIAGTTRTDTNIMVGNGTKLYYGWLEYSRQSVQRGSNLISYDPNVICTYDTIYFYGVSSFTLSAFNSNDISLANGSQPTFNVEFTGGNISPMTDLTNIQSTLSSMYSSLKTIEEYEDSNMTYLSRISSSASQIYDSSLRLETKLGNIETTLTSMSQQLFEIYRETVLLYAETGKISSLLNEFKNYNIPFYSYLAYRSLTSNTQIYNNNFLPYSRYNLFYDRPSLIFTSSEKNYAFVNESNNEPYIFAFFAYQNLRDSINVYPYSYSTDLPVSSTLYNNMGYYGRVWTPSSRTWLYFHPLTIDDSSIIVPLYLGRLSGLPDEIADILGIDKNASLSDEMNSVDQSLNDASDLESQYFNSVDSQFNNSLNNVTPSSDLISNSNFLNSANWVKIQFDRLTNQNAFGSLLGFSLLLGLALAIIGRVL